MMTLSNNQRTQFPLTRSFAPNVTIPSLIDPVPRDGNAGQNMSE
jgi:hypothetical protein